MIGIYKFTNKITGEIYIGKSTRIEGRYKNHKTRSNPNSNVENSYFHKKAREYGFENFSFEILEECDKSLLNEREQFYIKKFNSQYPNGYNLTRGGDSAVPIKISDDLLEDIIDLIRNSDLTFIEIVEKYNLHLNTISLINRGRDHFNPLIDYPIRKPKETRCVVCNKLMNSKSRSGMCRECYLKELSKTLPDKNVLFGLLSENSFEGVARMYGVTGNAVKKWCRKLNIPAYAYEYRNISSNEILT